MALSQHSNLLAFGSEVVSSGVLLGLKTGLEKIGAFSAQLQAASGSEANKAVAITFKISDDKKTVDIYCWKSTSTSNPTLVASTSAVTVVWDAIGE